MFQFRTILLKFSVYNPKGVHNSTKNLSVQVLTKDPSVHVYKINK